MAITAVTGSRGFIGSHMCKFLTKRGHRVLPVHGVDLRDIDKVRGAIKGADFVFHFAADMGGVDYFNIYQYGPFVTNMQIDLNLLKVGEEQRVKRMFYASSACIYPTDRQTAQGLKEDEIFPANADQMYGWEKLMMTMLSQYAPFDIRVGILHTIFGEGQEYEGKKAKFPPKLPKKLLRLPPITLLLRSGGTEHKRGLFYTLRMPWKKHMKSCFHPGMRDRSIYPQRKS